MLDNIVLKKQKAINAMNNYGLQRRPFLFLVDFEMDNSFVVSCDELTEYGIEYSIGSTESNLSSKEIEFQIQPIDFTLYSIAFDYVIKQITLGNSYLTNLTFPTKIKTNLTLDDIFVFSRAKYKLLFQNKFVVFSPECFVKIEYGVISSYPMKGTIDAAIPNAEKIILSDEKETAEHTTIVDLIRNDLSIAAKNVRVERFRYIDRIETNKKSLLQVSSKIVGELGADYNSKLGDIIFSMLPAGSISGAPKKKTVEIIQSAEKTKRGFYTGVFGYYDGNNLDSAVMIRFIENTQEGLFYRSGGGITFMSNVKSEYQELIDKIYVPFT
ncbi:MAG: TrpE protein [Ignavibacteria bacterium]|nr:MAG: TrpE protein [Ignavibacteria bacterium]KAF0156390.1 MAG: TrpE protein [Ignavibacteria bacterium]